MIKKVLILTLLSLLISVSLVSAKEPIVGEWIFQQYSTYVNDPNRPMLCIGTANFKNNGTYTAWCICRQGTNDTRFEAEWTRDWKKVSNRHYLLNDGDYDIVLSLDGKTGFFGSTRLTNPNMKPVYEWGVLTRGTAPRESFR